jgi:hypothetical protein
MGVLDEAIREHLELKRQHGAAEEELRRQEDEALGPARRADSEETDAGDLPPEDEEAVGTVDELDTGEPEDEELEPERRAAAAPPDYEPPTQLVEAEPDEVPSDEALVQDPEHGYAQGDPLFEEAERLPERDPVVDLDTEEHQVEEDGPDAPDAPDAAQEPERHGFEQRPPRDFDFD